jgi:hypothetical protein
LEEVEVSAAVHLSFAKLQPADLAFGLPVGQWQAIAASIAALSL